MNFRLKYYIIILVLTLINTSCKDVNHIDKYEVSLDSLKTLPDGFYAYRHGRIYFDDINGNYMIWFDLDNSGNVKSIFNIHYLKANIGNGTISEEYKIDNSEILITMQKFIELSRKFKFGHIKIDKKNKISFSHRDGLPEQYTMASNDSIKLIYSMKKDFKLLKNGWFEYIENK